MEQPIADIEEAIKNWDRRKSFDEKNLEEQRFERRIREKKTDRGDEKEALKIKENKKGR